MNLIVQVNAAPYQHQASDSAYHFTKAALEKGHEVIRVFFLHSGVLNGARLSRAKDGERDVITRWSTLAEAHDLDMVLCHPDAQLRGVVDQEDGRNLAARFRISGLGQLIDAAERADRLVVFGD